ncbi:MAG: hypothetical protein HYZ81_26560 [Nitrospinae bacterium]|nr:hypothetical protein [Nitrospinota bacterium]
MMGFVTPPDMEPSRATLTLTNEQINSVPLLLGVIDQMGIRDVIDAHVTPHGAWQGASVGTLVSIWLCHILAERDHRLVAVPGTGNLIGGITQAPFTFSP